MGSNSSDSSSNSFDPEYYGKWNEKKAESNCSESDIIVKKLLWRDVPMTTKGKEIGLSFARAGTFGFSEIKCKGKRISHDIIVVVTDKGPNYVLEWLNKNKLRPGFYDKYYKKEYDQKYDYTPTNMKLSNLRKIMDDNPGEGDCKDHAKLWWEKIKKKY